MTTQDRLWLTADRMLALAFMVVTQTEIWVFDPTATSIGVRVAASILTLIASGALAFRQTHPFATLVVNGGSIIAVIALGVPSDFYQWTNLVATYSVAAHGTTRQAWAALPVSLGGVAFYFFRLNPGGGLVVAGFSVAMWMVAWLAGRVYGARIIEARLRAERDLSMQLAAAQEERMAVEEERARIARELHDIIGHSVNVMVIHAGAGRSALAQDPTVARQAFETIEETGRGALDELDRVLAVLRRDDASPTTEPLPGIGDLDELVNTFRSAGIDTEMAISGDTASVPPSVGLSVYRIVQESLTNTLKHASAASASVSVDVTAHRVSVAVSDDGRGLDASPRPGRGTRGMRERAALHGGELHIESNGSGVRVSTDLTWEEGV